MAWEFQIARDGHLQKVSFPNQGVGETGNLDVRTVPQPCLGPPWPVAACVARARSLLAVRVVGKPGTPARLERSGRSLGGRGRSSGGGVGARAAGEGFPSGAGFWLLIDVVVVFEYGFSSGRSPLGPVRGFHTLEICHTRILS